MKSTPTFPSIASDLIDAAANVVVPVTTRSLASNVLLNDASPTTVKSPPIDKSLSTNKRLFILTSRLKSLPADVVDTSPKIAAAGIEAAGKLAVPSTVKFVIFAVANLAVPVISKSSIDPVLAATSPTVILPPMLVPVPNFNSPFEVNLALSWLFV